MAKDSHNPPFPSTNSEPLAHIGELAVALHHARTDKLNLPGCTEEEPYTIDDLGAGEEGVPRCRGVWGNSPLEIEEWCPECVAWGEAQTLVKRASAKLSAALRRYRPPVEGAPSSFPNCRTPPYQHLDPGVVDVVRALNDAGIETTDSGDGVSKPEVGRVCEFEHVAVHVPEIAQLEFLAACVVSVLRYTRKGQHWQIDASKSFSTTAPGFTPCTRLIIAVRMDGVKA